ncbi:MAG: MFS transporter [Candidatus Omnitrophota bacterium]|nr:MFS transporter [Candidatus Omnitrophota bacterium]
MPFKISDNVKVVFRTLDYRNFRLFFAGQLISLIGTWMEMIAMSWLVYRMTNSVFLLGIVGFSSQIPAFLLSPITGVMADRWDRHKTLIVTQTLSMVQAFTLAVLTLTGVVEVWHIIALGIFLGCVNSLDMPARQSFIVEMVEKKENLSNAIALNSLMFNAARLIGPSLAGIVVAMIGEGPCFLLNGISFFAVIASLLAMKINERPAANKGPARLMEDIKEGFMYAFGFVPIRLILFLLSVISLMGASYVVLMPVYARDILHGGPEAFGFLMSAAGIGAMAATIYLASRKSVLGLGRMMPIYSSIFAGALILFSMSRVLWLSLVLMVFIGYGFMAHMAASNTILQTIVDDDKRGRVMSLYVMSFIGVAPVGSLLAGSLASTIGVTWTLIIGGVTCIGASIYFAGKLPLIRQHIHPIYRKIGIIKEVASGIGAATGMSVPPED